MVHYATTINRSKKLFSLVFGILTDAEIKDYLSWSFNVQGHDYEWEQINYEASQLAEKHGWSRLIFYPYAWGGLQRCMLDPESAQHYYLALSHVDRVFNFDLDEEIGPAFDNGQLTTGNWQLTIEKWVKHHRKKFKLKVDQKTQLGKLIHIHSQLASSTLMLQDIDNLNVFLDIADTLMKSLDKKGFAP